MATKPSTLPRPWATNVNYGTGPFAGQPSKVDPGVGVAAEGHRPGANDPTAAEHENYQQNLVTAFWLPWVNSGSSAGAADAHIVETAASGRATLHGLNVTNSVDETAVNVVGVSTVAPVVFLRNTDDGSVLSLLQGPAAGNPALLITMDGAASGAGLDVAATTTSTGACVALAVPAASGSNAVSINHLAAGTRAIDIDADTTNNVEAMAIRTTRGVCLRLTDTGPLGTPLIATPRGDGTTEAGALYINSVSNNLTHVDASNVVRRNWNSVSGVSVASQDAVFTLAGGNNNAGTVAVASRNYTFVNGQRYWVEMACEVGRFTGSTRNLQVSALINGVALSFSGFTVELFQAGGATQLERYFRRRILYTATASGLLSCTLSFSVSGGAGNWNYGSSSIGIEGHYD